MASTDVLVVDDNSPDGTADLAERVGANRPGTYAPAAEGRRSLHPTGQGFQWGIDRVRPISWKMDADLATPMPSGTAGARRKQDDLVIGSRCYVRVGDPRLECVPAACRAGAQPVRRHDAAPWRTFGATSGYRAFRAEALDAIDFEACAPAAAAFRSRRPTAWWAEGERTADRLHRASPASMSAANRRRSPRSRDRVGPS